MFLCAGGVKEGKALMFFFWWDSWDGISESQSSDRWLQTLHSPEPAVQVCKARSFCTGHLPIQSLRLLTSRIQSKMCSQGCCVGCKWWLLGLSFSASRSQEKDSCPLYSLLVFLFLSPFYVHSLLRMGICTDRCPPCSAILLLSHKTGKGEREGGWRTGDGRAWCLCALPVESSVVSLL